MAAKKPKNHTYDVDFVRSAAAGRWPEILASTCSIGRDILDGDHHPCPRCGGTDRFRMIDQGAGALLCNNCFRDKNGDGFAAIQWARGCKFGEALQLVADHLGIEPSQGGGRAKKADPAEHLEFRPWNELIAATWCAVHKPGITPRAMLAAGCRRAIYRGQHTVFAFPHWGPKLKAADPVGWTLYAAGGGKLPKWSKKGETIEWTKVKITHGSEPGLIGPVEQLAAAKVIWKTEGPSDVLAVLSLDLPADHTAITNSNGAGEKPQLWALELFAGKVAYVIHDADKAGEEGATGYDQPGGARRPGWCGHLAPHAAECRHVRLPYPVAPDHGKDLRDWVNEDLREYRELLALADQAEVMAKPAEGQQATFGALEANNDPHRLARVNLERYASHEAGATIRYWRAEWYTWKASRSCYRRLPEKDLRARVGKSIKEEFDRINIEQQNEGESDHTEKVTKPLISNVLEATSSMVLISSTAELNCWLDQPTRRGSYIALRNGILDLDRFLQDDQATLEDVLLPASPAWFSTVCLPYAFDMNAECPTWRRVLEENMEGDQTRINRLQEWAGYCLTRNLHETKFLILEGDGSNGKSVYLAGIEALLGFENCSFVPLEMFGERFQLTSTLGRLANICGDVGEIDKVAEGHIKSFTDGNPMEFDRKGISSVQTKPTAKLMLACNNLPRFSDRTDGIWRRVLLVPWRFKITAEKRIRGMNHSEWWEASGEVPGIFLWALEGLIRLRAQGGFTASDVCDRALADYQQDANPTKAFFGEAIARNTGGSLSTIELYAEYRIWCDTNGYRATSERTFGKDVFRAFPWIEKKKLGTKGERFNVYSGISYSEDFQLQATAPLNRRKQQTAF